MKFFEFIRQYLLFLSSLFARPERLKVFLKQTFLEMESIGVARLVLFHLFQYLQVRYLRCILAINWWWGFVPDYLIGRIVRDSNILEFSPTITSLVLAGKVGSSIASEIGTMKVSEQIDALEIMGVNSRNYLVYLKLLLVF